MIITQSKTALGPGLTASFAGGGGTAPYTYSVRPGGAGGTIDTNGLYTAPAVVNTSQLYDQVVVKDSLGASAQATILVGDALTLFCDILQQELGLASGRVFLWDQKIFQPTDTGMYVVVSVESPRVFANNIEPDPTDGWSRPIQSVNMMTRLGVDIISRSREALDRKEEVVMALNGIYSQSQQEANSFSIGRLPPGQQFQNLSIVDGAAIPYRFRIAVNMQYFVKKQKAAAYIDSFEDVALTTEP